MAAGKEQSWEEILEERLGGKKPDEPVRLSDLAPPAGLGPRKGRGNPGLRRAPPDTAQKDRLPPPAAASPPDAFDIAWKEQAMTSDVVAELNDKLRRSEEARREAQARLAEVEWELVELREKLGMSEEARRGAKERAGDPDAEIAGLRRRIREAERERAREQAPAAGRTSGRRPERAQADAALSYDASSDGKEVAHLRRQLREAYAIIRAIEQAYLAGERGRGGDGDGSSG